VTPYNVFACFHVCITSNHYNVYIVARLLIGSKADIEVCTYIISGLTFERRAVTMMIIYRREIIIIPVTKENVFFIKCSNRSQAVRWNAHSGGYNNIFQLPRFPSDFFCVQTIECFAMTSLCNGLIQKFPVLEEEVKDMKKVYHCLYSIEILACVISRQVCSQVSQRVPKYSTKRTG